METYKVQIGGWRRRVKATTPEEAARKAAGSYVRSHDFFAHQSTDVAVTVEGIEYVPSEVATNRDRHIY